jgi:hypothetical protein
MATFCMVSNQINVREVVYGSHKINLIQPLLYNTIKFPDKRAIDLAKSLTHHPSSFFELMFNTAALKIELK